MLIKNLQISGKVYNQIRERTEMKYKTNCKYCKAVAVNAKGSGFIYLCLNKKCWIGACEQECIEQDKKESAECEYKEPKEEN